MTTTSSFWQLLGLTIILLMLVVKTDATNGVILVSFFLLLMILTGRIALSIYRAALQDRQWRPWL